MSGLGDFLGGSSPDVEYKTMSLHAPWQQQLTGRLQEMLGRSPTTPYEGALPGSAGMAPIEQLSLQGLEGMFGPEGGFAQGQTALSGLLSREGWDEQFQEGVADPMMRQFQEDILPSMERNLAKQYFGSGTQKMMGQGYEDLMSRMSQERGRQYESSLNRQLGAVTQGLPGMVGALGGAQQLGSLPRMLEEGKIAGEYGEFQRMQGGQQQWINNLMNALNVRSIENVASVIPGQTGFLQEMAGGIGAGLGGAMGGGFMDMFKAGPAPIPGLDPGAFMRE